MEQTNKNEHSLQQVYSNLSQDIQMPIYNTAAFSNTLYVNPKNIDNIVDMEMNRIKENCLNSEQQYVEQMLLENPIIIERRTNNNQQQEPSSDDEVLDVVSVTSTIKKNTNIFVQEQRAEACRRSRYNNKIKKAKSIYRHKYMSQKLLQSTNMFNCIHDLITEAENNLLIQGLTIDELRQLRHSYGIQTAIDSILEVEHTIKMDN